MMDVTSIILAGGGNLRLGRTKALEIISGQSLIERMVERLRPLSNRILIVTSREQSDLSLNEDIEVLVDIYPGRGPLGGIYTGLLASKSPYNIVVACDMPFLNVQLLHYMIELLPDFDAVVPRLGEEKVEPLHAVYSRNCVDKMKARVENERLGVHRFLSTMNVRYVERAECQQFDPQLLTFFNINYQSDLDQAISLADED